MPYTLRVDISASGGPLKACFACAEEIQDAAKLCRWCSSVQPGFEVELKIPKSVTPIPQVAEVSHDGDLTGRSSGTFFSESDENGDSHKKRSPLFFVWVVLLLLAVLVGSGGLTYSFLSSQTSDSSQSRTQAQSTRPPSDPQPTRQTQTEEDWTAAQACGELEAVYSRYFADFTEFRYSEDDGTGWTRLEQITAAGVGGLEQISRKIRKGIDWDSASIVGNLVDSAKDGMSELLFGAKNGFQPGRGVDALLGGIDSDLTIVISSACS
jgi:hypothetical protein